MHRVLINKNNLWPQLDLFAQSHTHYQVGVSENDPHIMYFWAALESFTPDELKKFIKFSCNLERLPITCPCQAHDHFSSNHQLSSASSSVVHVPPFPMKIAPIDIPPNATVHEIDKRLIRVETCMFLIRLPPYSSLQTTRQQLLFAINCRDDPLSGWWEYNLNNSKITKLNFFQDDHKTKFTVCQCVFTAYPL